MTEITAKRLRSAIATICGSALAAYAAIFHPMWDALWFWLGFDCYIIAGYWLVESFLRPTIRWKK